TRGPPPGPPRTRLRHHLLEATTHRLLKRSASQLRTAALVEVRAGESIPLTPTGPLCTVSGADEDAILAALRRYTDVIESHRATKK
ncbi:hypothetical protein ACWCZ5_35235, partial [Streptomyces sp. NPDC001667]